MTFLFKDTPENRAHADAINSALKNKAQLAKAEATRMKANAAFPVLAGFGAFVLCAGVGGGVALWGYSYVVGNKVIARQVAEGVKAALAHTTINVAGEVTVADGGEVALKAPAVVSLDPNSPLVVWVAGQVPADMPRPSPEQVRQDERPASPAAAVTNFTRFYTVPFGAGGEVQTAWVYQSSAQRSPSEQYCLYLGPTNGGAYGVAILGRDGRINLPVSAPAGVDLLKAASLCAWSSSAKPAPVAPSNANLIHVKN